MDGEGSDTDDESAHGSGNDNSREGRSAEKRKHRKCLAQEEKFLLEQLEALSAEVREDLEECVHLEYQKKVAEREAWLSFLAGVSPPPDGDVDAPGLRFDQYDPEGHADICERIQDHGLQGLAKKFSMPKARTSTSKTSSLLAMSQGLVFPESKEDETVGLETYWPGEIFSFDPSAGDSNRGGALEVSGRPGGMLWFDASPNTIGATP
ncbi:hypothetical protein K488DRAFT_91350 [Vararia minispora EC-137]|uniref:Uncharacterized protein n=1 Tax=Vararia minispora EC-137 TaxID=1314806 RepID=A0ACB8Q625_9AGAM|nr:hypothetical protein K488DRAFT_91350 [Vararia minispora EC-137]